MKMKKMNVRCTFNKVTAFFFFLLATSFCAPCNDAQAAGEKSPLVSEVPNLILVPFTRQGADYTCGVAAVQSIMGYYGLDRRQDILIELLRADAEKGTNYLNILNYAKSQGLEANARTNLTLDDLRGYIDARVPVLIALQAWMNPPVDWNTYNEGHYVVAIGYDQKNFYFMDPSTLGHYTYIPTAEFLERWHDHDDYQRRDLIHFGIIMTKTVADQYSPNNITRLE
jgi:predicted double-glycine peptidase